MDHAWDGPVLCKILKWRVGFETEYMDHESLCD